MLSVLSALNLLSKLLYAFEFVLAHLVCRVVRIVGFIGTFEQVEIARNAVQMIIQGSATFAARFSASFFP